MGSRLNNARITAEVEYDGYRKDEELCRDCPQRFKCWTSRVLVLSAEQFNLMSDVDGRERFSLTARPPACFTCGNMVGSNIKIFMDIDVHSGQVFNGTITEQNLSASNKRAMQITLEGVKDGYY